MGYCDFKNLPGGKRIDGFFVDENGRIHFWLTKGRPGYVLDEQTAEKIYQIMANKRPDANPLMLIALCFALVVVVWVIFAVPDFVSPVIFPHVKQFFSLTFTHELIRFGALGLAVAFVWAGDIVYTRWRVTPHLINGQKIFIPRPKLKQSFRSIIKDILSSAIGLTVFAIGLVIISTLLGS